MGIIAELCISLSLVLVNSFVIALVICLLCNRKTTYQWQKAVANSAQEQENVK